MRTLAANARHSPQLAAQRGVSLFELALVMGIVALLGLTLTVALPAAIDDAREQSALAQLRDVKEALIGQRLTIRLFPASLTGFGYIGDMGALPATLDLLADIGTQPDWSVNPTLQLGAGWRGPYLSTTINPPVDPWGSPLVFDTTTGPSTFTGAPIVATLRSMGPDHTDQTADDLSVELHRSEAVARLYGFVTRSDGSPMEGMRVQLVRPVNGVLAGANRTTDAMGFYNFNTVSHGDRIVRVRPAVSLQPGSVAVFGAQNQHVRFRIENMNDSAVSITSLTATYTSSPQGYYRIVRINGVNVFNNQFPRAASGTLVSFAAQPMAATTTVAAARLKIRTGVFQVPDIAMALAGGSLLIHLRDFRVNPSGGGAFVNMSGVTFSILLSDGSTIGFTTP